MKLFFCIADFCSHLLYFVSINVFLYTVLHSTAHFGVFLSVEFCVFKNIYIYSKCTVLEGVELRKMSYVCMYSAPNMLFVLSKNT